MGQREQGKNFKQRRVFGKYNLECVLLSSEAGREQQDTEWLLGFAPVKINTVLIELVPVF